MGKDALAPGLDEQMIGLKPGVQKTFTITYPDDYSDTTVAGMEAKFDVTINYIKITTTPEYTDVQSDIKIPLNPHCLLNTSMFSHLFSVACTPFS